MEHQRSEQLVTVGVGNGTRESLARRFAFGTAPDQRANARCVKVVIKAELDSELRVLKEPTCVDVNVTSTQRSQSDTITGEALRRLPRHPARP